MEKKELPIVCKSVFRSGESTSKDQFTKKFIELINQLENSKKPTCVKI